MIIRGVLSGDGGCGGLRDTTVAGRVLDALDIMYTDECVESGRRTRAQSHFARFEYVGLDVRARVPEYVSANVRTAPHTTGIDGLEDVLEERELGVQHLEVAGTKSMLLRPVRTPLVPRDDLGEAREELAIGYREPVRPVVESETAATSANKEVTHLY